MLRILFFMLALLCGSATHAADDTETLLDRAIAGQHRSAANKARDVYRHPKETLLFFGIRPRMKVVEVWPGLGWYTEILAPLLHDRGTLYAANYAVQSKDAPKFQKEIVARYRTRLGAQPKLYGKVVHTDLLAPNFVKIAPRGAADMVLTFRNVHNWAKAGNAEATFKAFYDALKPGGALGVVEHRAKPGATLEQMTATGYMTEEYVIDLAERAGFKLVAKSEINANPKDTKDHPEGVWTLPPTLRLGEWDREVYLAIGESDRMTLKFVKPGR